MAFHSCNTSMSIRRVAARSRRMTSFAFMAWSHQGLFMPPTRDWNQATDACILSLLQIARVTGRLPSFPSLQHPLQVRQVTVHIPAICIAFQGAQMPARRASTACKEAPITGMARQTVSAARRKGCPPPRRAERAPKPVAPCTVWTPMAVLFPALADTLAASAALSAVGPAHETE